MSEENELTCGGCRYFVAGERDPMNLAAPAKGECRFMPPSACVLATPRGIIGMASYPVVDEGFPACAQHEERAPRIQLG
jgi:hypothetical protein